MCRIGTVLNQKTGQIDQSELNRDDGDNRDDVYPLAEISTLTSP